MIGNKFVLATLAAVALAGSAPTDSFACAFCGGGGYTSYYAGYTPYYAGYWPASYGYSTSYCPTTCCRPTCCVPSCCSSGCGSGCATGCQGGCAVGASHHHGHAYANRVPRTYYGMANRQPAARPYVAQNRSVPSAPTMKPQALPAAKPQAKSPAKAPVVKPAPEGPIAKSAPRANMARADKKSTRETVIPVRSTEASRLATINQGWTPDR